MFQVYISELDEVDKGIYFSDLTVPENIQVLTHEEELIVKITALPVAEVEEVEEAAEAAEAEAAEGAEQEAAEGAETTEREE